MEFHVYRDLVTVCHWPITNSWSYYQYNPNWYQLNSSGSGNHFSESSAGSHANEQSYKLWSGATSLVSLTFTSFDISCDSFLPCNCTGDSCKMHRKVLWSNHIMQFRRALYYLGTITSKANLNKKLGWSLNNDNISLLSRNVQCI